MSILLRFFFFLFLPFPLNREDAIVNLAQHHNRPFHAIEHIELPFMILFFVLAGASLTFDSVSKVGLICVGYIHDSKKLSDL